MKKPFWPVCYSLFSLFFTMVTIKLEFTFFYFLKKCVKILFQTILVSKRDIREMQKNKEGPWDIVL